MMSSAGMPYFSVSSLHAALCDGEFALAGEGLRLQLVFVDGAHDEGRAEAFGDGADALEFFLAVLEIDGVDDAFALAPGERELHRFRIGGVDHDGRFDLADELGVEGRDVVDLVAVGALQADVDDVRAVAHLAARDVGGLFPFLGGDEIFEEARADHVGALADEKRTIALLGFHEFDARIVGTMGACRQDARRLALDHLRDGADVRGRGAAASAHEIQPAVVGEFLELCRQRVGGLAEFAF